MYTVIHIAWWPGYDGLVDDGYNNHIRVNHSKNKFPKGNGKYLNGI